MKPHQRTFQYQLNRNNRFDMRWVLAVVMCVAVLWAQSIPVMAGYGTSTSDWVEICADGGSYFIQVGEDGQKQAPECAHCDYCLSAVEDTQAVHSAHHSDSAQNDFSNISYSSNQAALPDNPEQYWSACRGPPIVSIENKMTSSTSLAFKEPIGSASSVWSIPCA